ncbi:MAG: hypothetical protein P8186_06240 [Anaerolineae bacterium]
MKQNLNPNRPMTYQIQVQGRIDEGWSDWFSGMTITFEGGVTTLTGSIADQAALRGMLCKLWDFNLTLISAVQIDRA